jgi:hypothetical protein
MALFIPRAEVERSWQTGDSISRVLRGHSDYIRCAQLEGSTLVTASGSISHQDCTIRCVPPAGCLPSALPALRVIEQEGRTAGLI